MIIILFITSVAGVCLYGFVFAKFFPVDLSWYMILCWFVIGACVIGFFAIMLWLTFDDCSREISIRGRRKIDNTRDIELKKYELVYQEITRYRDMSWKVSGLAWAIYYGLNWIVSIKGKIINDKLFYQLYFKFDILEFRCTIILTAMIATIFLIWGEHSLLNNRRLRLSLERNLGLDQDFSFGEDRLSGTHCTSLASITLFLVSIWLPVFVMMIPCK